MKEITDSGQGRSALDAIMNGESKQGRAQHDLFEINAPFRLQLECSSKCSADCSYCYAKVTEPKEPLSSREIRNLITKAASIGIREIDWMGGDPMEREDWAELMQFARYAGMTNNLWTCGNNLNDVVNAKRVADLTEGGFVAIHLDSLEPDVLTETRETYNPKVTREVLLGLRMLLDIGKPADEICNLIMMTKKQSVDDVTNTMVTMHKEYGIRTCLMSLKPVDDKGKLAGMIPAAEDVRQAYHMRDKLFLKGRAMGCMDLSKECCGTSVFVSLDGKVSPCYSIRRSLGSIRDIPFENIVSSNATQLFFTEFRKYADTTEHVNCDRDLCWGCRANALYFGSGIYSKDPLSDAGERTTSSCQY